MSAAATSSAGSSEPRRRGRRPGGGDTRAKLLATAGAAFTELGYDGATVRLIAERAGVDPAMVNHWFGNKESLFLAALQFPIDPTAVMDEVVPGDPEQLGARIVGTFLTIWDATGGGPLAATIQSVASHEGAGRMLRDFVDRVLVVRVVRAVAPDRPEFRATLVGTQIFGLGMARYVLKLEPLTSASHLEIIKAVAPTLQRYLTGDIG